VIKDHFKIVTVVLNAGLIRLVSQNKKKLLLKIQRKQHHILYIEIVYKHYTIGKKKKIHAQREKQGILIKERSTKAVENLMRVL
jgi:hypothetical protein